MWNTAGQAAAADDYLTSIRQSADCATHAMRREAKGYSCLPAT